MNVPDGYRMVDLSCTTGPQRQVVDPSRWALEPGGTGQCTAVNRRMSELTVEKLDADDGSTLPGAEFELYRDTDSDGTDGTSQDAPDADDYRVDTCTSGGNGRCAIGDLDFGDYYWYEKSAPDGYSLPEDLTSDIVTIDADNAGETHVTTFRDSRIPGPGPDPTTTEPPDPTQPTNPTEPTSTTGPPPGPGPSTSEGPDGPNGPGGPGGPGGAGDGGGGGPHGTDGDGSNGLSDTGADVGVPFALGLAFLVGGAALAALARRKPGKS
ncbi:Cna protein B-type domain-containing protein [Prauserella aidingensis]|uniref:prealbumin-like fold domain-containing protein n=1 Tax=Prauserella aidingensis TaxID=387890 RepID=UPI0020A48F7E|nr:prealbumin-like fold domain-containing protein [Prauserella aidingensis]MCP2253587.1 Cna protein B-type domain-containing protein [Prauserella aidingensis]